MRLPSLKFLKTFQVAARLQSFKAAAEELFVTPSAVSHQIKALEGHLGVALFERGVRTLTLTDASGPWEDLTVHELFAQTFIAACSPAFLLENRIDSYADLNGKTLLLHEERRDAWELWAANLGIDEIKPNRLVRLDTMSAVVLAAEQGVGIALVPSRLSADRFVAGGLVKLFDAELTTNESYYLLHRPEDSKREDLQELTQWILSTCRVS